MNDQLIKIFEGDVSKNGQADFRFENSRNHDYRHRGANAELQREKLRPDIWPHRDAQSAQEIPPASQHLSEPASLPTPDKASTNSESFPKHPRSSLRGSHNVPEVPKAGIGVRTGAARVITAV